MTIEETLNHLNRVSRAYNVGYAIGLTEADIDAMGKNRVELLLAFAQDVADGARNSKAERLLAQHPGIVEYALTGGIEVKP